MRQSTALLSILTSTVCASDVVSFYFPGGYEGVDPVATLNKVNPTMTEFHIACPTGTDITDCGWGPGLDATIISQTRYQATMDTGGLYMSLGCDYNQKKVDMTCTVNQKGGNDDTGGEATTATLSDDIKFLTMSVVAGNSLLRPDASSIPSASATTTKTSAQSPIDTTSVRSASTGLMTATGTPSATGGAFDSPFGSPVSSPSIAATPTSTKSSATAPESTGAAARFSIEGSGLLMLAGAMVLNVW